MSDRLTELRRGAARLCQRGRDLLGAMALALEDLREIRGRLLCRGRIGIRMKPNGGVHVDFDAAPTAAIATGEHIRRFDQIPDIMTMEIPPIEYLVDGMISRKTITLWTEAMAPRKLF